MNRYESWTDQALMQQIAERNDAAFAALYQRYSAKLMRFFFRMLWQDSEMAQDYLQELFLKVIEKAHLYDPKHKCATWLYAMASNMCKNAYRKQEVRRIMTKPGDLAHLPYSMEPDTVGIDRQNFQLQLKNEVLQLSETHREVFLLRFQEDLSLKEISEIMGCAEGTTKSRLFYALRKLADRLKVFDPKEGLKNE